MLGLYKNRDASGSPRTWTYVARSQTTSPRTCTEVEMEVAAQPVLPRPPMEETAASLDGARGSRCETGMTWEHTPSIIIPAGYPEPATPAGCLHRTHSKGRIQTFTEHLFLKEKPPEYVLLPGGQVAKQWDDPLDFTCCPVINPQSSTSVEKWDMVITTSVLITALWVPYEVSFVAVGDMTHWPIFVMDRLLDIIFLSDMLLQFMMSFPEERDGTTRWVRDRGKIVMNYISGWFWVDILALVPLDLLVDFTIFRSSAARKELKVVRLVRLFRLMKVGRLVKKWQAAWGVSYGQVALMKFATLTIMAVHWMSCMWGLLALQHAGDERFFRTWLTQLFHNKDFNEEEVAFYSKPINVYVLSLYWSVMTLTSLGYGDIVAENMAEYLFCIFCFVASGLIWAYVIGSICGIISAMDPLLLQYQQNMDLLNIMMADNNLPEEMRRRLRLYFQESRNLQRKVNQQTVIATLSPGLQGELAMKITHGWLRRVWYLDVLEADPVVEISKRLKPMIFASQELLVLNNNSRTLFIVMRGIVARGGLILGKNCVVGDDMIISNPCLRMAARPICVTFIEVVYLRNDHLDEIREAFPLAQSRIRRAQVRWALRRGFILAAWHRVHSGGIAGPRSTDYFKREVPSFSTNEAAKAWSSEATPRGSTKTRRNSTLGLMPEPASQMMRRRSLGYTGLGVTMPLMSHSLPPLPGRRQDSDREQQQPRSQPPWPSEGAAIGLLEQIQRDLSEGMARLEGRLDRVERRLSPGMLS